METHRKKLERYQNASIEENSDDEFWRLVHHDPVSFHRQCADVSWRISCGRQTTHRWSYAKVAPRVWGCCCAQRPVVHGMRLTARRMNAPIYDTRFEHLLGYGAVVGKCLGYLILCKPKQGDWVETGSRKFPFMQPLPPVHVQLSCAYPVDFAKHVQFVQAVLFKTTISINTAMLVQLCQSGEKQ